VRRVSPAFSATKVLTGKHTIVYDIVNPTGVEFLPNYSNSFIQPENPAGGRIQQAGADRSQPGPAQFTAPFPVSSPQMPPRCGLSWGPKKYPGQRSQHPFPGQSLTQESRMVAEAVTAIFNWIVDNFTYDAGRNTPQDGRSVFYSKRGSCVGYTNLSIAMLRSLESPPGTPTATCRRGMIGGSQEYWGFRSAGAGIMPGWKFITRMWVVFLRPPPLQKLRRSLPRPALHRRH